MSSPAKCNSTIEHSPIADPEKFFSALGNIVWVSGPRTAPFGWVVAYGKDPRSHWLGQDADAQGHHNEGINPQAAAMIVDKVTADNLAVSAAPAAALPNSSRHAKKRWAMRAQDCGTPYLRVSQHARTPGKTRPTKNQKITQTGDRQDGN